MAGEFYAGAYSITGGGYAAAMDGRDPFNPTQADEDEAGDALFKAVLFIGGEHVASKAFALLRHYIKAFRLNSLAAKGGTNLLKPLGLGSTGRTTAANLTEQLAMKEIMSNPSAGQIIKKSLSDPRWSGWSKMTNKTAHGVEIHYNALWKNGKIISIDDFKYITP
jgi:hypothetical protein